MLERRLEQIEPMLDSLREHSSANQGYASYAGLDSGHVTELALPVSLPTAVRLGPVPHLLPLLTVLETEKTAGLVSASQDALEVLESELGLVRCLDPVDLEPTVGDWWPEMKGPTAANPARGQQVVAQRERYERRLAGAYSRRLDEGSEALARVARRRRWARIVLAGDRRLTRSLEKRLPPQISTIRTESNLSGLAEADLRDRLRAHLARLVAREAAERIAGTIADEKAGGKGVTGLSGTLAALASARVSCLLIDPDRTFPGFIGEDGSLTADGAGGDLSDHIVAATLAAEAEVIPVVGTAADVLGDRDGIGARLRW